MTDNQNDHVRCGDVPEGTLHYHGCPVCYEKAPCYLSCTIEPDLSDERSTGSYMRCNDCATPSEILARSGVADPVEGVEVLHTRGRWPWSPGDPAAPRWWWPCEWCDDVGTVDGATCPSCGPHTAYPPSIGALIAVAGLGTARLLRLDAVATELAHYVVSVAVAIVFRVMEREELEAWSKKRCDQPSVGRNEIAVALSAVCVGDGDLPDPDGLPPTHAFVVNLARLGAYVVSIDASRIVLAVEAT